MKKISVWPLFALASAVAFVLSCGMMWLAGHHSSAWDSPSVITFILAFVFSIMSILTKHEKAVLPLRKTRSLRERKNNSAN